MRDHSNGGGGSTTTRRRLHYFLFLTFTLLCPRPYCSAAPPLPTLSETSFLALRREIRHNVQYADVANTFCNIQRLQLERPSSILNREDLLSGGALSPRMRGRYEGRLLASLQALNLINLNQYGHVRMAPTAARCRANRLVVDSEAAEPESDSLAASRAADVVAETLGADEVEDAAAPTATATATATGDILPRVDRASKVLLLSLGRSASTLVGEMLNKRPGSLYFFEPCRALEAWDPHSGLSSLSSPLSPSSSSSREEREQPHPAASAAAGDGSSSGGAGGDGGGGGGGGSGSGTGACLLLCLRLLHCSFSRADAAMLFRDAQAIAQSQFLKRLTFLKESQRFAALRRICAA